MDERGISTEDLVNLILNGCMNVPALMCDICDEAYLTPEASREIDKIVKDFREERLLAKPIAAR
jgi:hypothetical protein